MTARVRLFSLTVGLTLACSPLIGCNGLPPDEFLFARAVAATVVDDAGSSSGSTIVLDSSASDDLPYEVQNALRQRLDAMELQWTEVNLGGQVSRLPGTWVDSKYAGRRNDTHVLLSVHVTPTTGGRREVQWSYSCGTLCGDGGTARMRWMGSSWEVTLVRRAVF